MPNGDKVSEVKNNAYGLSLIISLNDRLGSKQYIFSFLTWSSFFFFRDILFKFCALVGSSSFFKYVKKNIYDSILLSS